MARKIAVIAALLLSVIVGGISSKSLALGLGEIELKSYLNQPLYAEIQLRQMRELTQQEILAGLAAKKEFDAAGVERSFLVTQLQFEVLMTPGGGGVIKVTTRRPIREPFLNFLVEVHWPAGRLLREYTLLLDPPIFDDSAPPALAVPKSTVVPTKPQTIARPDAPQNLLDTNSSNTQALAPKSSNLPTLPRPSVTDGVTGGNSQSSVVAGNDREYVVQKNDTLGLIAQQIKPRNKSLNQVMIAIQRDNPKAFIDGNINLVKEGEVLRLPGEEKMAAVERDVALAEVKMQMDAWRNTTRSRVAQVDNQANLGPQLKSSEESVTEDETVYEGEGVLRIYSPSDATSSSGADESTGSSGQASGNVSAVKSKLVLAEEELWKGELALEELNQQVAELSDQIKTSDQILQLKNEQLAALKAKLAELEQQNTLAIDGSAQGEGVEADSANDPLFANQESQVDSVLGEQSETLQSALDQSALGGDVEGAIADDGAVIDSESDTGAVELQNSVENSFENQEGNEIAALESVDSADASNEEPAAEDNVAPPAPELSLLDSLMSPMLLGLMGAVICLLILGFVLVKRSVNDDEEDDFSDAVNEPDEFGADLDIESGDETLMEFGGQDDTVLESDETLVDDLGFDEPLESDETILSMDGGSEETQVTLDDDQAEAGVDNPADMILIEETTEEEDDVADLIGEADIYIAYGRFDQSLDLLQKALTKSPRRIDVHSKLLDVFKESGTTTGFKAAAQRAISLGDEQLANKVNDVAEKLGVELSRESDSVQTHSGKDASTDHPVSAASLVDEDLDFDLDLDEDLDVTQIVAEQDILEDLDAEGDASTDDGEITLEDLELSLTTAGSEGASTVNDLEVALDESLDDILGSEEDGLDIEATDSLDNVLDVEELGEADSFDDLDMELELPDDSVESVDALADDSEYALDSDLDEGMYLSNTVETADHLHAVETPATHQADTNDASTEPNEADTKLDLARAYIDMGDSDGARDILDEVVSEGSPAQQTQARELLQKCG